MRVLSLSPILHENSFFFIVSRNFCTKNDPGKFACFKQRLGVVIFKHRKPRSAHVSDKEWQVNNWRICVGFGWKKPKYGRNPFGPESYDGSRRVKSRNSLMKRGTLPEHFSFLETRCNSCVLRPTHIPCTFTEHISVREADWIIQHV